MQHPAPVSSFDGNCELSQAPFVGRTQYETLTWDQLHKQRSLRGYHRKESKEDSETRLASMGVAKAKRIPVEGEDTGAAETIYGAFPWEPVDGIPTQS